MVEETSNESKLNQDIRSLKHVVNIFSHKWNPQVLYIVYRTGPIGYGEVDCNLDISSRMLSNALDELVDHGLIRRYEHDDSERLLYTVTPQGEALASHLNGLIKWQKSHYTETEILLVEDDKMAADLIRNQIDQIMADGYTLHHESTASQALDRVSQRTNYVILDRRLPGGTQAVNLTQRIRDTCQSCLIRILSGIVANKENRKLATDDDLEKTVEREEVGGQVE